MNTVLLVVVVASRSASTSRTASTTRRTRCATSVSTRALTPRVAVAIAAVANLAGAFITTAVAKTVGKGIIDTGLATQQTISPRSSARSPGTCSRGGSASRRARRTRSIGGLVGAAIVQSGSQGVALARTRPQGRSSRRASRPASAFAGAFVVLWRCSGSFRAFTPAPPTAASGSARSSRARWVSFTHGANDAQKTMGVIALALVLTAAATPRASTSRPGSSSRPASRSALGTYVGGWRIMRTLGQRIYHDASPPTASPPRSPAGSDDLPRRRTSAIRSRRRTSSRAP